LKNFLILHFGFKQPSGEEMSAWNDWFQTVKDIRVDNGGFRGGRKITSSGLEELPFGEHSITGYTIIEASDLDAAVEIAKACPVVDSTCVYEIHRG
jgi:hypothetical protein